MRKQIAAALCLAVVCSAVLGLIGLSSLAVARQRATDIRPQEWRVQPANQADGAATRLAQLRDGGASAQPTAKSAKPATLPAGSSNAPVYSSVRELMQSIIDPSADVLWGAVGAVVDQEGIHEMFPKTDEEWQEPRRAAVRIIEGGNLLMMPGREAAPAGAKSEAPGAELEPPQITVLIRKNRKSFDGFAKALQGLGVEALRAVDAKDTTSLLEIGARMEDVCESCHQTFWYPPERDDSAKARNNRPLRNR